MISLAKLIACGVQPTQARLFAAHLDVACDRFEIRTGTHQAAFLAQAIHESTGLTKLEESTFYRTPERVHATFLRLRTVPMSVLGQRYIRNPQGLANLAYANINGNGDEASGDGWRYRGRGLFQLTGRANYMAAGAALGRPYKEQPELVAQPLDAAMTAGWYWSAARLGVLLDRAGFDAVSKRVNGGENGLKERRELYRECLEALL
jgi:putative chitinase